MADPVTIKTEPPDLLQRMNQYPNKLEAVLQETNKASLYVIWENVPSYPSRPGSRYKRTGTLGRSLGVGMAGGKLGSPDILVQRPLGPTGWSGTFGSNVTYAADVIGEGTQKPIHQGIWWTLDKVARKAEPKINRLHEIATNTMARWLDGR